MPRRASKAFAPVFCGGRNTKAKSISTCAIRTGAPSRWTRNGWRIANEPPVHFIRRRGMLPLPGPVHGASIDELRPFLNGATERDFVLMVMWLLSALSPSGPYPLLRSLAALAPRRRRQGASCAICSTSTPGRSAVSSKERGRFVRAGRGVGLPRLRQSIEYRGVAVRRAVHHRHGHQLYKAPASHR